VGRSARVNPTTRGNEYGAEHRQRTLSRSHGWGFDELINLAAPLTHQPVRVGRPTGAWRAVLHTALPQAVMPPIVPVEVLKGHESCGRRG
jgi:hypothetical protein